jgi:hypothetical protein
MTAHLGTEGATTAAELRHAGRAVTSAACALLAIDLFARASDLGAVLDRVSPGATLGELVADHARDEIFARLETEQIIVQFN